MKSIEKVIAAVKLSAVCFYYHVKYGIKRWFGPRPYVFTYSFKDKKGEMYIDSELVYAIHPNIHEVMAHLGKKLGMLEVHDMRIISFHEAPACLFKGICIDAAEKLAENVDKQADALKAMPEIKPDAAPTEPEEDEDEDVSDMFK